MNRIALHQSTVHPMDPVRLVEVVLEAGIPSIGLRVTSVDDASRWWAKGIGSAVLRDLVAALLASRVTVLDVGTVVLGPELRVQDGREGYSRALELGVRLGAQFVTARTSASATEDPAELFGLLAELAARYRLRPLLSIAPGSAIGTLDEAAAVISGTGGGIVLDVSPQLSTPEEIAGTVVELGDLLGYVRIDAAELAGTARPGLLATLPPQVAVAIGSAAAHASDAAGPIADDHVARVTALRGAVDAMLRHPRAADVR